MQTKRCSGCKQTKPVTEFWRNKQSKDGYQWRCKPCTKHDRLSCPSQHGIQRRNAWLRSRYGIEQHDLDRMIADQGGCCDVCEEPLGLRPCIDHDHETGETRGILCHRCNIGLGYYELFGAMPFERYLARHSPRMVTSEL